jgi:hypothetical protein
MMEWKKPWNNGWSYKNLASVDTVRTVGVVYTEATLSWESLHPKRQYETQIAMYLYQNIISGREKKFSLDPYPPEIPGITWRKKRLSSIGVWRHVVRYIGTYISTLPAVSIFRIKVTSLFPPWRWRHVVSPKRCYLSTKLGGVTSKTIVLIFLAHENFIFL